MTSADPPSAELSLNLPGPAVQEELARVAQAAAADAGAPIELLGEYLGILADAALSGRRPAGDDLAAVRLLGERAAEQGVGANQAVDLYLSAAWRMWQQLPAMLARRVPHRRSERPRRRFCG